MLSSYTSWHRPRGEEEVKAADNDDDMLTTSFDDDSEVRERERERTPARNSGSGSRSTGSGRYDGMMVVIRRYERNSGSGRLSKVWM